MGLRCEAEVKEPNQAQVVNSEPNTGKMATNQMKENDPMGPTNELGEQTTGEPNCPPPNPNQLEIRPSQVSLLPGINLMVYLNNPGCRRRRRRRQMSSLVQICEEMEGEAEESEESEEEEISSYGGTNQNESLIISKVKATMAVGAALNVNLQPKHKKILKRMIELENKEAELLRRKNRREGNL